MDLGKKSQTSKRISIICSIFISVGIGLKPQPILINGLLMYTEEKHRSINMICFILSAHIHHGRIGFKAQSFLINGLLTYMECSSFDKFLPLYPSLRCLDFSKLHENAEEKNDYYLFIHLSYVWVFQNSMKMQKKK